MTFSCNSFEVTQSHTLCFPLPAVIVTSAATTSADYFTRVSPPNGEPTHGVDECAVSCVQDGGCVAFSYQSGSCTLITDPALASAAVGVVYQRVS